MERIVILQQNVTDFLENLVEVLFENHYFGFEESSQAYVSKIYDFIEFNLIDFPHKQTPEKLKRYGSKYIFYKINNQTTWYIFFENKDNRYLVTHITNNHMKESKFL